VCRRETLPCQGTPASRLPGSRLDLQNIRLAPVGSGDNLYFLPSLPLRFLPFAFDPFARPYPRAPYEPGSASRQPALSIAWSRFTSAAFPGRSEMFTFSFGSVW